MRLNVGDMVCLPDDHENRRKYSAACYGFILSIKGKFAIVHWFDGVESEEEIDWLQKL